MPSSKLARYSIYTAGVLFALAVCAVFLLDLSWWYLPLAAALFVPTALALGFFAGFFIQDTETVQTAQIWTEETGALIPEHGDVIGIFQGTEIYEWVTLSKPDGSGNVRCLYVRTFNLEKREEFIPPEDVWFCLTTPGILYAAEPENDALPEF